MKPGQFAIAISLFLAFYQSTLAAAIGAEDLEALKVFELDSANGSLRRWAIGTTPLTLHALSQMPNPTLKSLNDPIVEVYKRKRAEIREVRAQGIRNLNPWTREGERAVNATETDAVKELDRAYLQIASHLVEIANGVRDLEFRDLLMKSGRHPLGFEGRKLLYDNGLLEVDPFLPDIWARIGVDRFSNQFDIDNRISIFRRAYEGHESSSQYISLEKAAKVLQDPVARKTYLNAMLNIEMLKKKRLLRPQSTPGAPSPAAVAATFSILGLSVHSEAAASGPKDDALMEAISQIEAVLFVGGLFIDPGTTILTEVGMNAAGLLVEKAVESGIVHDAASAAGDVIGTFRDVGRGLVRDSGLDDAADEIGNACRELLEGLGGGISGIFGGLFDDD